VTAVYALIGVLSATIAFAFALSPVGKGDRYLAEAAARRAESLDVVVEHELPRMGAEADGVDLV
jgi:hypothetical protein